MPIRAHLPKHRIFEPTALTAMSTAFELSCADLKVFAGDIRGRETVALRIIDLASEGILDTETLHQRILAEVLVRA